MRRQSLLRKTYDITMSNDVTINVFGIGICCVQPQFPCLFYLFYTNGSPAEINSDHETDAQASAQNTEHYGTYARACSFSLILLFAPTSR